MSVQDRIYCFGPKREGAAYIRGVLILGVRGNRVCRHDILSFETNENISQQTP